MNWESWLLPKNSFMAAMTGLLLIRSWACTGLLGSCAMLNFSLMARCTRTRPTRKPFSRSSPTDRTRRLPRWSMSSARTGAISPMSWRVVSYFFRRSR